MKNVLRKSCAPAFGCVDFQKLKPKNDRLPDRRDTGDRAQLDRSFIDLKKLIDQARNRAVQATNAELITLYWHIGKFTSEKLESDADRQFVSAVLTQITWIHHMLILPKTMSSSSHDPEK